jgi:hypothetical protein
MLTRRNSRGADDGRTFDRGCRIRRLGIESGFVRHSSGHVRTSAVSCSTMQKSLAIFQDSQSPLLKEL